ncbi:MAG: hypothetical protein J7K40_10605 [candidate division Zixibacteria bacterium]|nr:hypothetical protein [candidate division Zixibacteria bacterium]
MRIALLFACVILLFSIVSLPAAIIRVTDDSLSIQEAIDSSSDGDTVLAADGRYYERITFDGKNIIVSSEFIIDGDTMHICSTIIDGDTSITPIVADTGSVVRFVNGEDSTAALIGFTVQNGIGISGYGGGIYILDSSPEIISCRITDNSASIKGGGIWSNAAPYIFKCSIFGNDDGGGLQFGRVYPSLCHVIVDSCLVSDNIGVGINYYVSAYLQSNPATILNVTVENNTGDGILCAGPYSDENTISGCIIRNNGGNGIDLGLPELGEEPPVNVEDRSPSNILNCVIEGNEGRGIAALHGSFIISLTIDSCLIADNTGGGIYFYGYEGGYGFTMSNTEISGNSAALGGGIYYCSGYLGNITNCLFYNNSAQKGGVIYSTCNMMLDDRAEGSFSNCTFSHNHADTGSAFYFNYSYSGTIGFNNCIIAFNEPGEAVYSLGWSGSIPVFSCTDIFGNKGGDWTGYIADQADSNDNFSQDPAFCDTANNDFHISHLSPCAPDNNDCEALIGALSIGCSGLNNFSLIGPPEDSILVNVPYQFVWQSTMDIDSGYAATYIVFIDDDSLLGSPIFSEIISDTIYTLSDTLIRSTRYYWRVQADNDYAAPIFSDETRSFYINGYPIEPVIIAPENNANADTSIYLTWLVSIDPDSFDAVSYAVQIDDDSLFNTPEINQSGLTSDMLLEDAFAIMLGDLEDIENLIADTRYYWRVRADDSYGLSSNWPDSLFYFIYLNQNHAPNPPVSGFSPADDEEVISLMPTITWDDAIDPDPDDNSDVLRYVFNLIEDTSCGSYQYWDTTAQGINQVVVPDTLDDNAYFYYTVKTIDDDGLESDWSAVQNFWTNHFNYPPEPFSLIYPETETRWVDYYTLFRWGNTFDYDPNASFDFTLQYSTDSLFNNVKKYECITDTMIIISTDSLTLTGQTFYWQVLAIDDDSLITYGGIPESEYRKLVIHPPGDANCDGILMGSDVIFLVNFFRGEGQESMPFLAGDANADCQLLGSDVTFLVQYFTNSGPAPIRGDCEQIEVLTEERRLPAKSAGD